MGYFQKSDSSPLKKLLAIFERRKYQKLGEILSHGHVIFELYYISITLEQKYFVGGLVRAYLCDILKPSETNCNVAEGVFESHHYFDQVIEDANCFFSHKCYDRCLVRIEDYSFCCRKLNDLKESEDNKNHTFTVLPNDYSLSCLQILDRVGLIDKL